MLTSLRVVFAEKDDVAGRFGAESATHVMNGGDALHAAERVNLNAVPRTPLLDTSASKGKAQLASSGALAHRRPPTKDGLHRVSGALLPSWRFGN